MSVEDVFKITIYHGYIIQILIAEFLFTYKLDKRKHYLMFLLIGLTITIFLSIIIPNLVSQITSGFFSLIIFLITLCFFMVLYKNKFSQILYCCISAQFTQNLSYNVENLFYLPFKENIDNIGHFFISTTALIVVYSLVFFIFIRKHDIKNLNIKGPYVYLMAVVTAAFVYLMQYLFTVYKIDEIWVTRLPLIVCCLFGLYLQFGFLILRNKEDENEKLELVIQRDNERNKASMKNVELLNMKAHDLKHFINCIKSNDTSLDTSLNELENIVSTYENTFNTGNETLDNILYEKSLVCNQNNIVFSVIGDKFDLKGLKTFDVYSIFSNAIENAIEYELKIKNTDKRYIGLTIKHVGEMIVIHFENYCSEKIEETNGLPKTTKKDSFSHGYGMKSIDYIVKKYNGTLTYNSDGNMFNLNILLPTESKVAK